uniref:Uncharacterized protein n=1 Tax=Rhizophora mucronata TaxID=61149 RepID=A0A2P2KPZ6_RHIMU
MLFFPSLSIAAPQGFQSLF